MIDQVIQFVKILMENAQKHFGQKDGQHLVLILDIK